MARAPASPSCAGEACILQAAEVCPRGELGALLRREGLYSSLLTHLSHDH